MALSKWFLAGVILNSLAFSTLGAYICSSADFASVTSTDVPSQTCAATANATLAVATLVTLDVWKGLHPNGTVLSYDTGHPETVYNLDPWSNVVDLLNSGEYFDSGFDPSQEPYRQHSASEETLVLRFTDVDGYEGGLAHLIVPDSQVLLQPVNLRYYHADGLVKPHAPLVVARSAEGGTTAGFEAMVQLATGQQCTLAFEAAPTQLPQSTSRAVMRDTASSQHPPPPRCVLEASLLLTVRAARLLGFTTGGLSMEGQTPSRGSLWDFAGRCVEGPLLGLQLQRPATFRSY
eukprot:gene13593-16074_t